MVDHANIKPPAANNNYVLSEPRGYLFLSTYPFVVLITDWLLNHKN